MDLFIKEVEIRWADLDPNFHVRHSAYYDWGASARISFLQQNGLPVRLMQEHGFGPVIFREECVFKRELGIQDAVQINLSLYRARSDYYKWTIRHTIYKNRDVVAAIITLDGAWLDTRKRKLTIPPAEVHETFGNMPRDKEFEWIS
ncbi:MAG: thioesterase family protein [Williamsia sp.]|nr:thioesterase family protein [Williamsia sp.]